MNDKELQKIQARLSPLFSKLKGVNDEIKLVLNQLADKKVLKGDELIGWLGEIYCKILFNGVLVNDSFEHDFITKEGGRFSVKARKGFNSGWKTSSLIRKIKGEDSPTNLLFVHFNEDYSIDRIWCFDWTFLIEEKRLKEKKTRNIMTGWHFSVRDKMDSEYLIIDNRNINSSVEDLIELQNFSQF